MLYTAAVGKTKTLRSSTRYGQEADYLLAVHCNARGSCSRHCGAAARLNTERSGSVTPLWKTFILFGLHTRA